MRGDGDVVSGWRNKLQAALANITPAGSLPNGTKLWLNPVPARNRENSGTASQQRGGWNGEPQQLHHDVECGIGFGQA